MGLNQASSVKEKSDIIICWVTLIFHFFLHFFDTFLGTLLNQEKRKITSGWVTPRPLLLFNWEAWLQLSSSFLLPWRYFHFLRYFFFGDFWRYFFIGDISNFFWGYFQLLRNFECLQEMTHNSSSCTDRNDFFRIFEKCRLSAGCCVWADRGDNDFS